MSHLKLVSVDGNIVADSREIAEMTKKRHDNLMRDIDGYVEILNKSTNSNLRALDFFIPSTYEDEKGEIRRCYKITKIGCDMVANKMTGEKGVLFTATYVTEFEEMKKRQTHSELPSYMLEDPEQRATKWIAELKEKKQLEQRLLEYEPKVAYVNLILSSKSTLTTTQIAKDYGLTARDLNKILHEDKVQFKQNDQWLLYQKHQDNGYTKSETIQIVRSNGDKDITLSTRWTQEGRLFINQILVKRGILPYMDRKENNKAN